MRGEGDGWKRQGKEFWVGEMYPSSKEERERGGRLPPTHQ